MDSTGFQMSRDQYGNIVYTPINQSGLSNNAAQTMGIFGNNSLNGTQPASFLNRNLGDTFGGWFKNNDNSIFGNIGNTLGSLDFGTIGSGIFNGLGLYNTFQANKTAQKQLDLANQNLAFQKDAYYRNLGNQISEYNSRVEDLGNTRYKMTGDSRYLDQANERKLSL